MHEYLMRRNTVLAALRADRRNFYNLWIQDGISRKPIDDILRAASERDVEVHHVGKQKISQMAEDNRHQGVLLETGSFIYSDSDEILELAAERNEKPLLLVLDLLHGPQNIGSLLRTAEICGVHGVIVQDRRAPDITPAVTQYSAGAAEYLLVSQVTNLAQTIDKLKDRGVWVAGLDLDDSAVQLGSIDLDFPLAITVGHEGGGLRRIVRNRCDFILRLPMRGQTDSLNAAVAGSVLLYAAWQARGFNSFQIQET